MIYVSETHRNLWSQPLEWATQFLPQKQVSASRLPADPSSLLQRQSRNSRPAPGKRVSDTSMYDFLWHTDSTVYLGAGPQELQKEQSETQPPGFADRETCDPKEKGCGGARTELRGGRRPGGLTLLLLQSQLAFVVTVELASKQKREFRVVLLFLHRHFLELRPVASHELSELVDDISKLLVCRTEEKASMGAARTRGSGRGPLGRAAARRPCTGPE